MKCEQIRERMPDVAAGLGQFTLEEGNHLTGCKGCTDELQVMRGTMSLLDEWQVPEPSPYFDTRLQARLREEMAKSPAGWLHWFRRPVLAAALTVMMGVGVGLFVVRGHGRPPVQANSDPGTAVSDLSTLDKNHDMYQDFELLDDLEVQQDVVANP